MRTYHRWWNPIQAGRLFRYRQVPIGIAFHVFISDFLFLQARHILDMLKIGFGLAV